MKEFRAHVATFDPLDGAVRGLHAHLWACTNSAPCELGAPHTCALPTVEELARALCEAEWGEAAGHPHFGRPGDPRPCALHRRLALGTLAALRYEP